MNNSRIDISSELDLSIVYNTVTNRLGKVVLLNDYRVDLTHKQVLEEHTLKDSEVLVDSLVANLVVALNNINGVKTITSTSYHKHVWFEQYENNTTEVTVKNTSQAFSILSKIVAHMKELYTSNNNDNKALELISIVCKGNGAIILNTKSTDREAIYELFKDIVDHIYKTYVTVDLY